MLGMREVHVLRHRVVIEGKSQRAVAREMASAAHRLPLHDDDDAALPAGERTHVFAAPTGVWHQPQM